MIKDDKIYLYHIRDSINLILDYTQDITYEEFLSKRIIQDALITQFQIIGQASSKLSKVLKDKYDHIPWKNLLE